MVNQPNSKYAGRQTPCAGDPLENIPSFATDSQLLPAVAQDASTGEVLMLA